MPDPTMRRVQHRCIAASTLASCNRLHATCIARTCWIRQSGWSRLTRFCRRRTAAVLSSERMVRERRGQLDALLDVELVLPRGASGDGRPHVATLAAPGPDAP